MNNLIQIVEMEMPADYEVPKWEPREADPRTFDQWRQFIWHWILNKLSRTDKYRSYACPHCGGYYDDNYPSSTMISCGPQHYNYWASYEFGGTAYDWDEEHQCENCGTVFGFSNGTH